MCAVKRLIYGSAFDLVTDHKVLESILVSSKVRMPVCIERCGRRLVSILLQIKQRQYSRLSVWTYGRHTRRT